MKSTKIRFALAAGLLLALPNTALVQSLAAQDAAPRSEAAETELLSVFRQAIPKVMEQKFGDFTLEELARMGKLKGIKPKRS